MIFDEELLEKNLKSLESYVDVSQSDIEAIMKSESDEKEKTSQILDLFEKSKKKKVEKAEDEDYDDDDEDEMEKGKKKEKVEKSLEDNLDFSFDDEELQDHVDANPVLQSIFKSIKTVNKRVKENDNKDFLKSIAQVQLETAKLIKSMKEELEILKSYPLALKGQLTPSQMESFNGLIQKSQGKNVVEDESLAFLKSNTEVRRRMNAAYQKGDVNLTDFTIAENYRFNGEILKSQNPGLIELLKSYES